MTALFHIHTDRNAPKACVRVSAFGPAVTLRRDRPLHEMASSGAKNPDALVTRCSRV